MVIRKITASTHRHTYIIETNQRCTCSLNLRSNQFDEDTTERKPACCSGRVLDVTHVAGRPIILCNRTGERGDFALEFAR